jgi:hypothetical protein
MNETRHQPDRVTEADNLAEAIFDECGAGELEATNLYGRPACLARLNEYWLPGVDLIEVVSDDSPDREIPERFDFAIVYSVAVRRHGDPDSEVTGPEVRFRDAYAFLAFARNRVALYQLRAALVAALQAADPEAL